MHSCITGGVSFLIRLCAGMWQSGLLLRSLRFLLSSSVPPPIFRSRVLGLGVANRLRPAADVLWFMFFIEAMSLFLLSQITERLPWGVKFR